MKASFTLPFGELAALQPFTAPQDGRPILQGISVEVDPGKVLLTATDGRKLATLHAHADTIRMEGGEFIQFIFPAQPLRYLYPSLLDDSALVTISYDSEPGESGTITLSGNVLRLALSLTPIYGNYPDYRSSFAGKISSEKATPMLNPRFVGDLHELLDRLMGRSELIMHGFRLYSIEPEKSDLYGQGPVLLRTNNERLWVIVMPMHNSDPTPARFPEWLEMSEAGRRHQSAANEQERRDAVNHIEADLRALNRRMAGVQKDIAEKQAELDALRPLAEPAPAADFEPSGPGDGIYPQSEGTPIPPIPPEAVVTPAEGIADTQTANTLTTS